MSTPTSTSQIKIYHHPSPLQTLSPSLTRSLPYSLPLLRRLQFHFQSPHARTFATFPPPTAPQENENADENEIRSAIFVDRSRAPETQAWIWTSLAYQGENDEEERRKREVVCAQLLALLRVVREGSTSTQLEARNSILIGAVREDVASLLSLSGVTTIRSEPWLTFLYRITEPGVGSKDEEGEGLLAALGLCWSTVHPEEFALVRSRTAIQRSDSTLRVLPCVAVRREERLLGWAFLGVDGSLVSLFVEEDIRGKGVGRLISRRVLQMVWREEAFEVPAEDKEAGWRWGFSHVGVENAGSIAVAKALGGTVEWTDYWVTVDLEAC